MTKLSLIILGCALVSVAGCSEDKTSLPPPGHYEHSSSRTAPDGTAVSTERSTDVTVDSNGNRRAVVEEETTTDPPGLFNSRTSTNTRVVQPR